MRHFVREVGLKFAAADFRRFNGLGPIFFRHEDAHQRGKCLFAAFRTAVSEHFIRGLRPVKGAGLHKVLRQFRQSKHSFRIRQFRPIHEVRMNAYRLIKLTAFAEKVSERMMQLDRLRIEPHHFHEVIDRFFGFVRNKQRQPLKIILVEPMRLHAPLPGIKPAEPPAGRKEKRNKNQVPKFKIHNTPTPERRQ